MHYITVINSCLCEIIYRVIYSGGGVMLDINCIINDCIFEVYGKCTLTHASTPSNYLHNECIYFRPNDCSIGNMVEKEN